MPERDVPLEPAPDADMMRFASDAAWATRMAGENPAVRAVAKWLIENNPDVWPGECETLAMHVVRIARPHIHAEVSADLADALMEKHPIVARALDEASAELREDLGA